jgi:hypothetical protein
MINKILLVIAALGALICFPAEGQTAADMAALNGLAPVTQLPNTTEGKAALAANYTITGGIQTGAIKQPTLLPFAQQQVQALQDAFMTDGNFADLADGLGTTLGAGYIARTHYIDRKHFTNISPVVADVIAYAYTTSGINSNTGKYFFANGTEGGTKPVSAEATALLKQIGGTTDVYGKSYDHPAGSSGADRYGNSRPFQTEPRVSKIVGPDYFNAPADNDAYNRGPIASYVNSPSYPSGHTTYAYTGALVLAFLVPERYEEMIARAGEYGNDRILMGSHYAMDVLAGRTLALYDMAHLLANDPAYVGQTYKRAPAIKDFPAAIQAARTDVTAALQTACSKPIQDCAREDIGRLSNPAANEAFYTSTQTYNLPVVYPGNANASEDVGKLAPEAGYLLTAAFPSLTLEQADRILTETEGPGGGFLDNGSSFGVYSRLNLYDAAGRAAALAPGNSASARHSSPSTEKYPAAHN